MRVLVVEGEPMTCDGLCRALSAGGDIEVAQASTGKEALQSAPVVQPDVVFTEVKLPDIDGIQLIGALREVVPDVKAIVFTRDGSHAQISNAIQAGISGYLLKDATAKEVLEAARLTMQGEAVLHPTITKTFIEAARVMSAEAKGMALSKRELEVLRMMAKGRSGRAMGEELGISPHTVKVHAERIFKKLEVNSRSQAVGIGMRRGLID